jgi:hypothetical protein
MRGASLSIRGISGPVVIRYSNVRVSAYIPLDSMRKKFHAMTGAGYL